MSPQSIFYCLYKKYKDYVEQEIARLSKDIKLYHITLVFPVVIVSKRTESYMC
ncbi:hypothetical protein DSO57_1011470 [Entomophthora muscae]|uniref:Uncharacterized protein n=1 Tax=Entomophthora muscae TaxID=34485 RepID=A0ACC2S835_9FUNG|nr:hypothetical protein DSO57_1011470 [Entomophthora muscae]